MIYAIYVFLYLVFIYWKIIEILTIIQCVLGIESALVCESFHIEMTIYYYVYTRNDPKLMKIIEPT